MDPNVALAEIRSLIQLYRNEMNNIEPLWQESETESLVSFIEALDNWLTSGGFRPDDWS